jgi:hypothetical protein
VSYVQSSFTLAKRLDHEGEVEEAEEEAVLCRLYGVAVLDVAGFLRFSSTVSVVQTDEEGIVFRDPMMMAKSPERMRFSPSGAVNCTRSPTARSRSSSR